MTRKRTGVLVSMAVAAAGLGGGTAVAATGSAARTVAATGTPAGPSYSWYRSWWAAITAAP